MHRPKSRYVGTNRVALCVRHSKGLALSTVLLRFIRLLLLDICRGSGSQVLPDTICWTQPLGKRGQSRFTGIRENVDRRLAL